MKGHGLRLGVGALLTMAASAQVSPLTLTVNNPVTQTVAVNQPYTVGLTLNTSSAYNGNWITYSVSIGTPTWNPPCSYAGGTWSFNPPAVQSGNQFYLPAGTGTYTINFTGNAISDPSTCLINFNLQWGSTTVTAIATVYVMNPYVSASVTPASQVITINQTYTFTGTVTSQLGWTGTVYPSYGTFSANNIWCANPGFYTQGTLTPNTGVSLSANSSFTFSFTGNAIATAPASCSFSFSGTDASNNNLFNAGASFSVVTPKPPVNVSVSPASGTGGAQTFAFTASDANGSKFVSTMQMLFNYGVDGAGACYLQYSPPSNVIYLMNNQGTAWSAGKNLGAAGTLANSQCQLNLAASSVSMSGNNVTANLALTFLAGLPGPQNVYMLTYEPSGLNTGWQQMGTWTTSSVSSQPPVPVSVSPTSGTGPRHNLQLHGFQRQWRQLYHADADHN
jgi:hypothetical protein